MTGGTNSKEQTLNNFRWWSEFPLNAACMACMGWRNLIMHLWSDPCFLPPHKDDPILQRRAKGSHRAAFEVEGMHQWDMAQRAVVEAPEENLYSTLRAWLAWDGVI